MHFQYSFLILIALALHIKNATAKHLAEKPAYLKTCDFNDANLNSCFANSFKVIFNEWKSGVPGLKHLSPLDPLSIKRIRIQQDNGPTLNVDAVIENLIVHGISQVIIKNTVVDTKALKVDATLDVPKLHLESGYKAKGSVLGFNINGQGPSAIDTSCHNLCRNANLRFQIHIDSKLHEENNLTFVDILNLKLKIVQVGDLHIDLKNLFGGNTELENTTHVLFNQNWRELLGLLQPAFEQAMELVLKNHLTKIFSYVPANYFFVNLPKAS